MTQSQRIHTSLIVPRTAATMHILTNRHARHNAQPQHLTRWHPPHRPPCNATMHEMHNENVTRALLTRTRNRVTIGIACSHKFNHHSHAIKYIAIHISIHVSIVPPDHLLPPQTSIFSVADLLVAAALVQQRRSFQHRLPVLFFPHT